MRRLTPAEALAFDVAVIRAAKRNRFADLEETRVAATVQTSEGATISPEAMMASILGRLFLEG